MHERQLLTENELQSFLPNVVTKTNSSIIIVSAYLKTDVILWLYNFIPKGVDVSVVTRWRRADILKGSSDFDAYDICRSFGWSFHIDQRLHAKILLIDQEFLVIGSSNYTKSGLGFNINSNLEMNLVVQPTPYEVQRVKSFVLNSFELDDVTHSEMALELMGGNSSFEGDDEWSAIVQSRMTTNAEKLWISECLKLSPDNFRSLPEHTYHADQELWGGHEPTADRAKKMRIFNWLDLQLDKENKIYNFGELSSLLHSSIINDPSPYRKEIKECISVLFDWVEEFDLYEIVRFRRTKGMRK